MRKINIGIDGPAGSGKGTVAKLVADALGYLYIDTGIMYRMLAYLVYKNNISFDDDEKIKDILVNEFDYEINENRVYFNEDDVTDILRGELISEKVSLVACKKYVREFMVNLQQNIASEKGIVMDGRDITSVVMPAAELKVYLDADVDIRARRRFEQLKEKDESVTFESVRENLMNRDYQDKVVNKTLVIKEDSIVIDSSLTTVEEVVSKIINLAKERIKND